MAETRRVSSASPVRPAPPRRATPRRRIADETVNLMPAAVKAGPDPIPKPAREELLGRRAPAPPRDRALLILLLFGLAINAGVLVRGSGLTPYDRLLGAIVFFAGVALLGLLEAARRTSRR